MIEDAVRNVKNQYTLGEIVNDDELHGEFINLALSSQREQGWRSIPRIPASLRFAPNWRPNTVPLKAT